MLWTLLFMSLCHEARLVYLGPKQAGEQEGCEQHHATRILRIHYSLVPVEPRS